MDKKYVIRLASCLGEKGFVYLQKKFGGICAYSQKDARKFESKEEAYKALLKCNDRWIENAKIVRLRPKA